MRDLSDSRIVTNSGDKMRKQTFAHRHRFIRPYAKGLFLASSREQVTMRDGYHLRIVISCCDRATLPRQLPSTPTGVFSWLMSSMCLTIALMSGSDPPPPPSSTYALTSSQSQTTIASAMGEILHGIMIGTEKRLFRTSNDYDTSTRNQARATASFDMNTTRLLPDHSPFNALAP